LTTESVPVFARKKRTRASRESRKLGFLLYEAFYGPVAFLRAVYRQLIVLFFMFFMGAAIFSYYEKLNLLDAFLASISTITTIGLYVPNGGNFATLNRSEAALLIVLIIVSVGAGASIVQSTVNTVVNGALAKGEAEKKMISRIKKHAIVFGYSHLGRYVADKLDQLGMDYVVITKNPHVYQDLLNRKTPVVLEHETRPIEALREAGIAKAGIVIVSHDNDPDNMLFILSARKLRPDIRIITVVHDSDLTDTAKNAGANTVIPSAVTLGHLLALSAITEDLVGVVFSEKIGTKEIAQFSVFKGSPLIGQQLETVSNLASVIGIVRGDSLVPNIFDRDFRVQVGDTLLVLGDPAKLEALEEEAKAT
jgi:voltage-gated potassium channel